MPHALAGAASSQASSMVVCHRTSGGPGLQENMGLRLSIMSLRVVVWCGVSCGVVDEVDARWLCSRRCALNRVVRSGIALRCRDHFWQECHCSLGH
jgi:hypothetical protein